MSDNLPERAAIVANKNLVMLDIEQMYRFAKGYAQAGVFQGVAYNTTASPEDLFVRISAGQAIGLDPYTSVSEMYFVKGKLTMSTNLQLALAKASGKYDYRVEWGDSLQDVGIDKDDLERAGVAPAEAASWPKPRWCRFTVYSEPGHEQIGQSLWTMLDSKVAGLLAASRNGEPSNHLKYPRAMMFNRAGSSAIAYYMPDATMIRAYDHGEVSGDVWSEQRGPSTVTAEVVQEPQPSSSAAGAAVEEEVIQDAEVMPDAGSTADAPAPNDGQGESATSAGEASVPEADEPLTEAHDEVTGEMREGESAVEAMERMVREEALKPEAFNPATEPAPAPVQPPGIKVGEGEDWREAQDVGPLVESAGPTVETSEHVKTLELPRQKLLFALCRRANLTDARRYEITTEVCGQPHMDRVPDSAFQAMLDRLNAEVAMVEDPGPEEA